MFPWIEKGKDFILYRSTVHRSYTGFKTFGKLYRNLQLIHKAEIAKKDADGY